MNKIIKILMERDGLTYDEASDEFKYAQSLIHEAVASGEDWDEVEEIMYSELGLEMDYIFEIL